MNKLLGTLKASRAGRIHCGINIDPANPQGSPTVQEIQDLGAAWVRFTFKDDSDGPQSSSFGDYDGLVRDLNAGGIKILMILSYETYPGKPASDADEAAWNAYAEKFVARCQQIADHYGQRVGAYQIWNEPDFLAPSTAYDPCVQAELFGPLLKSAFAAIKEVSSATVVVGGLAAGQPSYVQRVRVSTAGVLHADAVGVHPHGRRPTPDWPRPDWGFGTIDHLIRQYHAVAGKPVWITEVGTDDVAVQGEFPDRVFRVLNDDLAEVAPYVFWFCWSDGMVKPFGLIDANGNPKASYGSFKDFATSLADAGELNASKPLIAVEQADGGWRVLARQGRGAMCQVTVVPSEEEAREIAACLMMTVSIAVDRALRKLLLGSFDVLMQGE